MASGRLRSFFFKVTSIFLLLWPQYSILRLKNKRHWNASQEETILIAGILLNLQSAENQTCWILKSGISRHQAHYFKFSPLFLKQETVLGKCLTLCFPVPLKYKAHLFAVSSESGIKKFFIKTSISLRIIDVY